MGAKPVIPRYVFFTNDCNHEIDLFNRFHLGASWKRVKRIPPHEQIITVATTEVNEWQHGISDEATMAQIVNDDLRWYAINVVPPGATRACEGFKACQRETGRVGFNVGMAIRPIYMPYNSSYPTCVPAICSAYTKEECADAYHFMADSKKAHFCPEHTNFEIIFCPGEQLEQKDYAP